VVIKEANSRMVSYTEVILRRVPGCYLAGSFPGVVPAEGDGDRPIRPATDFF